MIPEYLRLCFNVGLFAALNGFFTKLTFDWEAQIKFQEAWSLDGHKEFSSYFFYAFKILGICGIISANVLMWKFFNKALGASKTSLQATLAITAFNLLITAFLGKIFMSESLNSQQWLGNSLIVVGLSLIVYDSSSIVKKEKSQ